MTSDTQNLKNVTLSLSRINQTPWGEKLSLKKKKPEKSQGAGVGVWVTMRKMKTDPCVFIWERLEVE